MKLYDINKLPSEEGILRFPISMARIANAQSAEKCFEYLDHINPSKIVLPKVGVSFCYGDFLYLYSDTKSYELKKKFGQEMVKHKNACMKVIKKPHFHEGGTKPVFFIEKAFAFDTWNKLYLDYNYDIFEILMRLRRIYDKDLLFQKYLKQDLEFSKKTFSDNQLMFFLEEHLIVYLIAKGKIKLHNEYTPNYRRILVCYPGPMLKQHIYLLQKNFFKLENSSNKYENCWYNLESKKLYDASKIDLDEYNYEH